MYCYTLATSHILRSFGEFGGGCNAFRATQPVCAACSIEARHLSKMDAASLPSLRSFPSIPSGGQAVNSQLCCRILASTGRALHGPRGPGPHGPHGPGSKMCETHAGALRAFPLALSGCAEGQMPWEGNRGSSIISMHSAGQQSLVQTQVCEGSQFRIYGKLYMPCGKVTAANPALQRSSCARDATRGGYLCAATPCARYSRCGDDRRLDRAVHTRPHTHRSAPRHFVVDCSTAPP